MFRTALRGLFLALLLAGCGGVPDPRTIDGALAYAARAIEHRDPRTLFRVLDVRSRHAMISIVADRQRAKAIIERSYPADVRAEALAELGDGATVADAPALFAKRCDRTCIATFRDALGAVVERHVDGDETVVRTTRGETLRLYRRREGDWWGLVFQTDELFAERDRASRDREMIAQNARTYERRRALEAMP